jgi:hypothetical protein
MGSDLCRMVIVTLLVIVIQAQSLAQEAPGANAETGKAPAVPAYIEQLRMTVIDSEELVRAIDRPLFSYADSARRIADGGIWAWGDKGRPLAVAKCWKNPNGLQTCALSLTSEELVVARGIPGRTWRPERVQVEPAVLDNAPVPDIDAAGRMRQLKQQARRFTAHEFWDPDNSRFELRLLVQPVHRYQDEGRKILDGAIFLLAFDNNPQIVLLLEILEADGVQAARWQYLLARVSCADLHVLVDGK